MLLRCVLASLLVMARRIAYYRLGHAAKPEHMAGVAFNAAEQYQCLADCQQMATEAQTLQKQVPANLQDAYFKLILYSIQGAQLMKEKVFYVVRSLELAKKGDDHALVLAQKARTAYNQIQALIAPADSKQWRENVLRGFSQGQTTYEVAASGPATIRLYLLDAGLVVNQIQIQ
jgi:hypothetical protein